MSQRKVDEYKEEKKGRKERVAKERRAKLFWKIAGPILALVIIVGIGALVYFLPTLTEKAQNAVNASETTEEGVSANEIDYDKLMEMLSEAQAEQDNGSAATDAEQ